MPTWRICPSTITPTRSASVGGVLEVVRDEDRRQRELAQQLVQLDPHRWPCVWASSAESGSSRSSTPGRRASARARATRWRSPPERSLTRARARCAMPNRSSSSPTCALVAGAERTLRARRGAGRARTPGRGSRRSAARAGGRCPPPCRARRARRARRAPAAAAAGPATTRSTVVFPAPDGPTSATVSPSRRRSARRTRRSCEGDG